MNVRVLAKELGVSQGRLLEWFRSRDLSYGSYSERIEPRHADLARSAFGIGGDGAKPKAAPSGAFGTSLGEQLKGLAIKASPRPPVERVPREEAKTPDIGVEQSSFGNGQAGLIEELKALRTENRSLHSRVGTLLEREREGRRLRQEYDKALVRAEEAARRATELTAAFEEQGATLTNAEKQRDRFLRERDEARRERQKARSAADLPTLGQVLREKSVDPVVEGAALLGAVLERRGWEALLELLVPEGGPASELLESRIRLWCGHSECEEELVGGSNRISLLQVAEETRCENCRGSDNRRAINRMTGFLRRAGRTRLLVVGGAPDSWAQLNEIAPSTIRVKTIDGTERRTKRQAADDLRGADMVVVWGPTLLAHKVSALYTEQREAHPGRILLCNRRGIAGLAREVLRNLGDPRSDGS